MDIKKLDVELNQMILKGDILTAFDKFYAENCSLQENSAEPTVGFAANRAREEQFLASVDQWHGAELVGSAVDGDRSYSEWTLDATYKGAGRIKLAQVAARTWKDGKVVFERFYYNKG